MECPLEMDDISTALHLAVAYRASGGRDNHPITLVSLLDVVR